MTGTGDAFTRFEHDGWSRAAEGHHRFFSPVTGQVVEPLLDAAPWRPAPPCDALVGLLHTTGLFEVQVRRLSYTHRAAPADELWEGVLGGTVRTSALVDSQPPDVRWPSQW